MRIEQLTGDMLHKLFDTELSKVPHDGANYSCKKKAFHAVVKKLQQEHNAD